MAEETRQADILRKHATIDSGRLPEMLGATDVEQIHIARYRFALSVLPPGGGSVLDIASGIGYGSNLLAQDPRVTQVTGVDVSSEAIGKARASYRSPKLRFEIVDGKKLPFADGAFDTVVSFETVEHTVDGGAFLAELRRVLRDGGRLVISTPNKRFHSHGKRTPWNPFHTIEYTPEEFRALLDRSFGRVEFWGGQEFLATSGRDLLRYNWIEFRYYNIDHHPLLSRAVIPLKKLKRSLLPAKAPAGEAGAGSEIARRRADVVPWSAGLEPYTMVAICLK